MRVKCECCGCQLEESDAYQEIGGTYLCEVCDRESQEDAERRHEEQELSEYASLESIYRAEWRYD